MLDAIGGKILSTIYHISFSSNDVFSLTMACGLSLNPSLAASRV